MVICTSCIPEKFYCFCLETVTPDCTLVYLVAALSSVADLTVTLALSIVSSFIILVQIEIFGQIHDLRLRSLALLTVVGIHFILIKLPLRNSKRTDQTHQSRQNKRRSVKCWKYLILALVKILKNKS